MGLLQSIFGSTKKPDKEQLVQQYYETLTGYKPAFKTFEGSLYEMELTRAAIHSFATHCSKLKPVVKGEARTDLAKYLPFRANAWQVTSQYLYRLATILMCNNNAFIFPIVDENEKVKGFFPALPASVELKEYKGELWYVYKFAKNQRAAIEFERVGLMTQFQYKDDFFGENNSAMQPTLELMNTQNQGIIEGIKQGAAIRFIAILNQTLKNKDIDAEKKRFSEANLKQNYDGVMMIDQKYKEVKQIESKPYIIDADQIKNIRENVFNYFGTNEKILQNNFTSAEWNAYYEGKIEPFSLQAGLVHTAMIFTEKERSYGNEVFFESNRLQYLSPQEKMQTVIQLFDRGFLTHNQGLEIFNLPGVPGGDRRFIRREYAVVNELTDNVETVEVSMTGGDNGKASKE